MITIKELTNKDLEIIKVNEENWEIKNKDFTIQKDSIHIRNKESFDHGSYPITIDKRIINTIKITLPNKIYLILIKENYKNKLFIKILLIDLNELNLKKEDKVLKIKNNIIEFLNLEKFKYYQYNYSNKKFKEISLNEKNFEYQINTLSQRKLKRMNLIEKLSNKENKKTIKIIHLEWRKTIENKLIKKAEDELKNGTGNILDKFE